MRWSRCWLNHINPVVVVWFDFFFGRCGTFCCAPGSLPTIGLRSSIYYYFDRYAWVPTDRLMWYACMPRLTVSYPACYLGDVVWYPLTYQGWFHLRRFRHARWILMLCILPFTRFRASLPPAWCVSSSSRDPCGRATLRLLRKWALYPHHADRYEWEYVAVAAPHYDQIEWKWGGLCCRLPLL